MFGFFFNFFLLCLFYSLFPVISFLYLFFFLLLFPNFLFLFFLDFLFLNNLFFFICHNIEEAASLGLFILLLFIGCHFVDGETGSGFVRSKLINSLAFIVASIVPM